MTQHPFPHNSNSRSGEPSEPSEPSRATHPPSSSSPFIPTSSTSETNDATVQPMTSPSSTRSVKSSSPNFTEVDSLREQASPYCLAIAELPIELLDYSWSRGNNRPLDRNHVANICRSFQQGGLARGSEEHYIQVSCSAAAIEKMTRAIPETDSGNPSKNHVRSFRHWADVNDERPELMAGQHRIEALRDYVKQTHSAPCELWWICEFYDKGAVPSPTITGH
ncbi:hypothetical protein ACHAPJ_013219 [Fusarium lateritium]